MRVQPAAIIKVKPGERSLIFGDTHAPHHSKAAIELCKELIKFTGAQHRIQVGDLGEFSSVSSHGIRKGQSRDLIHEVDSAVALAKELRLTAVTEGNHCDRVYKYIGNTPTIENSRELDLKARLLAAGVRTVVHYNEVIQLGEHIWVTHAHSTGATHAAASSLNKTLVFGHTHRAAIAYAAQFGGDPHALVNVGWLADFDRLRAHGYMSSIKASQFWTLGAALVDHGPTNLFNIQFIPFIEERGYLHACCDGKWCAVKATS